MREKASIRKQSVPLAWASVVLTTGERGLLSALDHVSLVDKHLAVIAPRSEPAGVQLASPLRVVEPNRSEA
jgi:hypothetical protein